MEFLIITPALLIVIGLIAAMAKVQRDAENKARNQSVANAIEHRAEMELHPMKKVVESLFPHATFYTKAGPKYGIPLVLPELVLNHLKFDGEVVFSCNGFVRRLFNR